MARRGGLGQRGLDLLIPGSSGTQEQAEETAGKKTAKKKAAAVKKAASAKSKANTTSTNAKTNAASRKKADASAGKEQTLKEQTLKEAAGNGNPLELPIEKVEPNREQPRRNFDEDSLQELAESIKAYGVLQPLVVQKRDDYYEIIAGERRWRASRLAGLKTVPAIIREYTPREVMEVSLIENIQREDLNPIEEAAAYRRLMEEYGLRQDEVAERVMKSRAAIANAVRLLNLDPRVQEMVIADMLSTGHARALLPLTEPEQQYRTAQRVFDEKMSVREVERLVKKMLNPPKETAEKKKISDELAAVYGNMEEQMKQSLGTKVSIAYNSPGKGRIEIEYYSTEELERLYQILRSADQEEMG